MLVALAAVLWGKVEGKFLRNRATATAVAIVLSVGEGAGACVQGGASARLRRLALHLPALVMLLT